VVDDDGIERRHGWLPGPHGEALAVKWFQPPTATGATVLLVRSIGHEDDATTHGVHHAARVLAAAGHPTVLLNLSGTGQSFGALDGDAPSRWIDEVASVVARLGGDTPSGLVVGGHRLGALVAAHALARPGTPRPGAVLLWHLPAGGRRFVRELRIMAAAQRTSSGTGAGGDGLQIGAHRYGADLIAALDALPGPPAMASGVPVHVVAPVRAEVAPAVVEALGAAGAVVTTATDAEDWVAAGGIDDLVLPAATVSSFVTHLAAATAVGSPTADDAGLCTVVASPDGAVVEEMISIDDGHLTGVLTRPRDRESASVLVLLSARGPGNAFIEIARAQAAAGRSSLRFDLSGFGMNPARLGHEPGEIYTATAANDVALGVDEVHRRGHACAVVVGFCAGGWAALRARPHLAPAAVVAINVELFARNREWMRPRAGASGMRRALVRAGAAWPVVTSGSVVELLYDEHDAGYAYLRSSVERHLRRARDTGHLRVTTFPALGHFTEGPDAPAMVAHLIAVVDRAEHDAPGGAATPSPS
jgi:pimeloyl-ACP methyl ester carboxylesterase